MIADVFDEHIQRAGVPLVAVADHLLPYVHLMGGLRFFTGRLEPVSDWPQKLVEACIADFGEDQ